MQEKFPEKRAVQANKRFKPLQSSMAGVRGEALGKS